MIFLELHVPVVIPVICSRPSHLSHLSHPSHSVISAIQHILVISVIPSHFSYHLSSQSSLAIPVIHPCSSQYPQSSQSFPVILVIPSHPQSSQSSHNHPIHLTTLAFQSSLDIPVIPHHPSHPSHPIYLQSFQSFWLTCTILNLLIHCSPLIFTSIVFRDRGIVVTTPIVFPASHKQYFKQVQIARHDHPQS